MRGISNQPISEFGDKLRRTLSATVKAAVDAATPLDRFRQSLCDGHCGRLHGIAWNPVGGGTDRPCVNGIFRSLLRALYAGRACDG